MAFSAGSVKTSPSISEINVTPLVDVMLVLLIIFMVTAPIIQSGIEVNLPQTRRAKATDPGRQAVITISRDERLFYRSKPANFHQLGDLLRGDLGVDKGPVYLQADEDVRWKTVVSVIDEVRVQGFENLNLVTKPTQRGDN